MMSHFIMSTTARAVFRIQRNFAYIDDPLETDAKPILHWTRTGWTEGRVLLGGKQRWIQLTDNNLSGIFDRGDCWILGNERADIFKVVICKANDHF